MRNALLSAIFCAAIFAPSALFAHSLDSIGNGLGLGNTIVVQTERPSVRPTHIHYHQHHHFQRPRPVVVGPFVNRPANRPIYRPYYQKFPNKRPIGYTYWRPSHHQHQGRPVPPYYGHGSVWQSAPWQGSSWQAGCR